MVLSPCRSGVEISAGETKGDVEVRLQKPGASLQGDGTEPVPWRHARKAFQYAGIGAAVRTTKSGGVMIDKVFPGSAAEEAGLTHGTTILEVDGQPVTGGVELRQAVEMLRGEQGVAVTMRVRRPDGTEETIQPIRKAHTVGAKRPKG